MANIPSYTCSSCAKSRKRSELIVKKAVFLEMGEGARTIRSRVIGWYCKPCLGEDGDFNRPARIGVTSG